MGCGDPPLVRPRRQQAFDPVQILEHDDAALIRTGPDVRGQPLRREACRAHGQALTAAKGVREPVEAQVGLRGVEGR
jgi:hypothetical protein